MERSFGRGTVKDAKAQLDLVSDAQLPSLCFVFSTRTVFASRMSNLSQQNKGDARENERGNLSILLAATLSRGTGRR